MGNTTTTPGSSPSVFPGTQPGEHPLSPRRQLLVLNGYLSMLIAEYKENTFICYPVVGEMPVPDGVPVMVIRYVGADTTQDEAVREMVGGVALSPDLSSLYAHVYLPVVGVVSILTQDLPVVVLQSDILIGVVLCGEGNRTGEFHLVRSHPQMVFSVDADYNTILMVFSGVRDTEALRVIEEVCNAEGSIQE